MLKSLFCLCYFNFYPSGENTAAVVTHIKRSAWLKQRWNWVSQLKQPSLGWNNYCFSSCYNLTFGCNNQEIGCDNREIVATTQFQGWNKLDIFVWESIIVVFMCLYIMYMYMYIMCCMCSVYSTCMCVCVWFLYVHVP